MSEFQVSAQVLKPAGSLTSGPAKGWAPQYPCPFCLPPSYHFGDSVVFVASLPGAAHHAASRSHSTVPRKPLRPSQLVFFAGTR